VIPPHANAAFVAAMEDMLAFYTRPCDPECPVVCLDEASKQLVRETRVPIPGSRHGSIISTNATEPRIFSCCSHRSSVDFSSLTDNSRKLIETK